MEVSPNPATDRTYIRCLACLLLLIVATLGAQARSVPTQATHEDIDHWLRSGDLRLVAWGSTFAVKNNDQAQLPLLASLAENYHANGPRQFDGKGDYIPWSTAQQENYDCMQAVVDSLIQLHGKVTYEAIVSLQPDFSDQAMVLLATMAEPARTQAALAVYDTRDRTDKPYDWHDFNHQQMVHVAAAILAHVPPSGFTATLLNEATIHIEVVVPDDGQTRYRAGTVTCGDSPGLQSLPGWPQPYTYVVEESWKGRYPTQVIVAGEPAITVSRDIAGSSCSRLSGFSNDIRLHLLNQEASVYEGMRHPRRAAPVPYTSTADYLARLSRRIAKSQKTYRDLAAILAAKSYLTPVEAQTVTPTFIVEIVDERSDKSTPLPTPSNFGARVIVTSYKPKPSNKGD